MATSALGIGVTLLRLDPPVPTAEVRKPRALKLKPSKPSGGGPSAAKSTDGDGTSNKRTVPPVDDILNAILPPQAAAVDPASGQPLLLQCVSSVPASRLDLVSLQERLDDLLLRRQAKESGVCAVRAELYAQAFDELIRQVTLECPERGLLLLRLRDEQRSSIAAHRLLYQTSVAFGTRKALTASNGLSELKATQQQLEKDRRGLELQVLELQAKCERIETDSQAQRSAAERKHAEVVNFYRKTNHQLASQVKTETDRANTKK